MINVTSVVWGGEQFTGSTEEGDSPVNTAHCETKGSIERTGMS